MYQGRPTGLLMGTSSNRDNQRGVTMYGIVATAHANQQAAYTARIAEHGILAALAPYRPAQIAR